MTRIITVAGTDCFFLAAKYLGDANQFYRILSQNQALLTTDGVADPVVSGTPICIVVPDPETNPSGGVPTL